MAVLRRYARRAARCGVPLHGAVRFRAHSPALPHLLASPGASIINIGSVTVGKSLRGHLVYETAKAALTQLTKSLAADLGPRVRVNIIIQAPPRPPPCAVFSTTRPPRCARA